MAKNFYKPANILALGLHHSLAAGLLASTALIAQPWMALAAAGFIGVMSYSLKKHSVNFLETKLQQHPESLPESPHLGQIAKELYQASGLSADKYPIYDFKSDNQKTTKGNFLTEILEDIYNKTGDSYNAAAGGSNKKIIMISRPLLKLLDDEEEKAVLAHEFTHAAASHTSVRRPQYLLRATATMTGFIAKAAAKISMGWLPILTVLGGQAATLYILPKLLPNVKMLGDNTEQLSFKKNIERQKMKKLTANVLTMTGLGIYTAFSPAFAITWVIAKGISLASDLIQGSQSRRFEFQADRGATELGANPLALATSLRKIEIVNKQSMEAAYGGPLPKKNFLSRAWEKATRSHPVTDRRVERLCKIARKQGYNESAIEKARNGTIDIDPSFNIPPETLKQLMF